MPTVRYDPAAIQTAIPDKAWSVRGHCSGVRDRRGLRLELRQPEATAEGMNVVDQTVTSGA
jgi:hypothetical protein